MIIRTSNDVERCMSKKSNTDFGISRLEKLQRYIPDMYRASRKGVHMVVFSGPDGLRHYLDERMFELPPYSLLYIGDNRLSRFCQEAYINCYVLFFSSVFYCRSSRDAHFLQHSPLFNDYGQICYMTPPSDGSIYRNTLVHLLYTAKENMEQPLSKDLAHNIIQQILIMGELQHNQSSRTSFREDQDNFLTTHFTTLIAAHYKEERRVKFYADKLNITERRLNRAIENSVGLSAKEMITKHVMDEARWQLAHSRASIKEISGELGFSGENNFSTFFLKNEGIRPIAFRRINRQ